MYRIPKYKRCSVWCDIIAFNFLIFRLIKIWLCFGYNLITIRLCDEIRKMVLFDGMSHNSPTTTKTRTKTSTTTTTRKTSRSTAGNEFSLFLQSLGIVRVILILSKSSQDLQNPFLRNLWNIGLVKLPSIENYLKTNVAFK
jgi:hypothetical protein